MSKLTKLMNNPSLFFRDSVKKRGEQLNSLLETNKVYNGIKSLMISSNKTSQNFAIKDKKTKASTTKNSKGTLKKSSNKDKSILPVKESVVLNDDKKLLETLGFIAPEYNFGNDKEVYMYLPWIKSHGDTLVSAINSSNKYEIYPLKILENYNDSSRKDLSKLARQNPEEYRRVLLTHLAVLKKQIKAVILTFDWHPVMRILVDVCKDLDIKTILVLHESVFLVAERYYMYEYANFEISLPKCDYIITWGQLQKDIFIQRGVSEDKIKVLGAPKFDVYDSYKNLLSREDFCMIYGLDYTKRILLYALQPMDVQVDQTKAIRMQNQAVLDVMEYCENNDFQLILREPPTKTINTIFRKTRDKVANDDRFFIDVSGSYLLPVAENLYHVDALLSVNSTMILEALLIGTPVVSTKYFDFTQIWDALNIPVASEKEELINKLNKVLFEECALDDIDWTWAENALSVGKFDGKSASRIVHYLENIDLHYESFDRHTAEPFSDHIQYIANSNPKLVETTGRYLPYLLNFEKMVKPKNEIEASLCDAAMQWGVTPNQNKKTVSKLMKKFGKRPYIIEDGFIRSVGIGLSKEPTLSITMCGYRTAYYDSYQPSRFEEILNSDKVFTEKQLLKAKNVIKSITENHISKYNDSPYLPVSIGKNDTSKVLVIDQRFGDESVKRAKANESDFQRMLIDSIKENPNSDIIIKRHPDAIKADKGSYYSDENLGFIRHIENVYLIDYDIHPHQLLQMVDKVYVCSSGLGFEAVLYGKNVICYGVPFYSNWGITTDKKIEDRRTKIRSVEEVFYTAYIECSRYYSPDLERTCDIEDCIEFIVKHRVI